MAQPECETPGCGYIALTPPLCSLCAMGKGPSEAEAKRNLAKEAGKPKVKYMGAIEELKDLKGYNRHVKSAESFALSPNSDGSLTTIGDLKVHHRTVPRANYSIWYRRTAQNAISVYGFGRHIGKDNKNYEIEWYDGKTKKVTL